MPNRSGPEHLTSLAGLPAVDGAVRLKEIDRNCVYQQKVVALALGRQTITRKPALHPTQWAEFRGEVADARDAGRKFREEFDRR